MVRSASSRAAPIGVTATALSGGKASTPAGAAKKPSAVAKDVTAPDVLPTG
ncbi:hypothetical protein [Rhodoblastus sp.]|uniref:hypothetical protein n=1 Tax=Rhodoblastus sp. TaxID=1962975 RepID=UPI003F9D6668